MREKMKIICVVQGNSCVVCDSPAEARATITDWIEEGYMKEEIDVYTASGIIPFVVETSIKATVTFAGRVD